MPKLRTGQEARKQKNIPAVSYVQQLQSLAPETWNLVFRLRQLPHEEKMRCLLLVHAEELQRRSSKPTKAANQMKRGLKKFLSTKGKKKEIKDQKEKNINNSIDNSRRRSNKLHKHDLDARTCARASDLRRKNSKQASASETLEGRKQAFPKP